MTRASANSCRPRVVATYVYADEQGDPVLRVLRYEPGLDGEPKAFRQQRPDGNGGWLFGLEGVRRRPPYRLPELAAADPTRPVFVVEGEKDVDNLHALEVLATTNAMGAEKWTRECTEALRGRHVVILPDNDDKGRRHARQVSAALRGAAASVLVVELPGLPEKGDVGG